MFWKFATTSNIDAILDKEDVTLVDLMDDDDVLQECKGQNTKLVKFLCQLSVMEELVSFVITEPASDSDEAMRYKYPNIACELLTSDVPQMNDMLGDTESLREKLFSFLDNEPVLNPLLASFFSKVVGILLSRKAEPTLEYIKSRSDFLGSVLKHLGTSAIMDLLLRLVTCVESVDLRAQVLSWLNENKLVERLIGLIDPSSSDDFHCNSAQSLCDMIRLSREHMYTMQESAQEDPLLNTLERKETVQLLLRHMFDKEINESVIINGISVLLALLEIRRPAPFGFPEMAPELTQLDVERLACGVSKTLHGLSDRLGDFNKLLESPPQREVMHCTFGELDPPLGNTRLHVGKLLAAVLATNTHNINVQLSELQIFNALLDLFFRYQYNNFLHTQVVQCIQTVLTNAVTVTTPQAPAYSGENPADSNEEERKEDDDDGDPRKVAPLLTHLFEDCRLIHRILDAWEDNKVQESEGAGHRKGNMGHLTIMANQILDNMQKGANGERIRSFIEGMPEEDQGRWQKFVAEPLAEMNEKNSRELGGHNPMHFSSDDEGDADFRDIPFNSNSAQQFGFTDGDFADQDDSDTKFDKINSVDFDIKANTNTPNQELFEDVCRARLPNFGDSSDEEENKDMFGSDEGDDEWDVTNNTSSDSPFQYGSAVPTVTVRPRSSSGDSTGSSSSEEGESPKAANYVKMPDVVEEMDTHSHGWKATFDDSDGDTSSGSENSSPSTSPRAAPSSSTPVTFTQFWTTSINTTEPPPPSQEENWANFDDLDDLSGSQEERKESSSAAETSDRSQAYQHPDSTSEAEGNSSIPHREEASEKMDVGIESSSSKVVFAAEEKSAVEQSHSSGADVMEVQEVHIRQATSSLEEEPSVSSDAVTSAQEDDVFQADSAAEATAMETDDDVASSDKVQPVAAASQQDNVQDVDAPRGASSPICHEVTSSSPNDSCEAVETVSDSSSTVEVEQPSSTVSDAAKTETDNIVAYVTPVVVSNSPEISASSPEGSSPVAPVATSSDSVAPANGDSANAASKLEGDLQNSEVTSSTVSIPPQMNGPV